MVSTSNFLFRESGRLVVVGEDDGYNYTQYCVNPIPGVGEQVKVCAPPESDMGAAFLRRVRSKLVPALLAVSVVFLTLTFAVIFHRNRDKMFGVMTLCMVAMLAMFYIGLIVRCFAEGAHFKGYSLEIWIDPINLHKISRLILKNWAI
jgi:hypothetical protein